MKNNINNFLKTLEKTNIELNDLIDIDKIIEIIDELQIKLNTLNYIISSNQMELNRKIEKLFASQPEVFSILPYLVAISKDKIKKNDFVFKLNNEIYKLNEFLNSSKSIITFLELTGLNKLILEGKIKNFVDFLTGIEVGLDTNARKNRIGTKNEKEIDQIITKAFSKYQYITIDRQLILEEFQNTNLLNNKKIDFIITNQLNNKKVIIETSYYNSSGSKIIETAKSFENLNKIIKDIENYYFLWIADGGGINSNGSFITKNSEQFSFVKNKNNFIDSIKEILEIKD